MSSFTSRSREDTWKTGKHVYWQRQPASTEEGAWNGNPCNGSSTQNFAVLTTTKAKVNRKFFVWSMRKNALTNLNTRPNLTGNPVFRRTQALPFQSGVDYTVTEKILESGTTYSYNFAAASISGVSRGATTTITIPTGHGLLDGQRVKIIDCEGATWLNNNMYYLAGVTATTARLQTSVGVELNSTGFAAWSDGGEARYISTSFAADSAKWSVLGGTITHNECRIEYTTHLKARNATLARLAYMVNRPQFDGGRGWGDYSSGMTTYLYSAAMASKDSIFVNRPLDITSIGATNYAVNTDIVLLTDEKITDSFVIWAANTNYTRGDLIWVSHLQKFYWCTTTHKSNGVEFEADPSSYWEHLEIWILFDHECADDTPFLISDGPGSMEYFLSEAAALCEPWGIKVSIYTNDLSSRRTIATRNGWSETNLNLCMQYAQITPITDGRNAEGGTLLGNAIENFNRVAYVGGNPANGFRSNFTIEKYGAVVEMLELGGNITLPMGSAVAASPTTVTVTTAPLETGDLLSLPIVTGDFVHIKGTISPDFVGVFKISSTNSTTSSFTISHKVLGIDPVTAEPILQALDSASMSMDVRGGVAMIGGHTLPDFCQTIDFLESKGVKEYEPWLNFTSVELNLPTDPVYRITGMTNTQPVVITLDRDHPFVVGSTSFGRAGIIGAQGFTNLNGCSLDVEAIPASNQIQLSSSYSGVDLPAWTGGGEVFVTRQRHTYERLGRMCLGWGP